MTLMVRPAIAEDGKALAQRLRAADQQEIQALSTETPLQVLQRGIHFSRPGLTLVNNAAEPVAIFGVVPDKHNQHAGLVWLLGADEIEQHRIAFLRLSRLWSDKFLDDYRLLWNLIDARNHVHLRWLRWCGFSLCQRLEDFGIEKRVFYRFVRQRLHAIESNHRSGTPP